ncbi:MBL fold metallo-hydrolase [Natrinema salifodinae]|uniref:L-ascorbate metabolism protein UlaG, beta-lactamase superfamily n=1 Tax=Natrinema salifodinae TaxID=1202768 RepID=A0A1I0PSP8_9EURY|nr:MBL fold metallo-hydrolase [Natrinema salifodinae]SEW17398.1 L-ascorbate metabolism protein UlaG, beta-lactamase superfamily [Natrinema salifodinae]
MRRLSDADIDLELPTAETDDADLENGSIFFVGTATVIIEYAGFTILTDPNFLHSGDHVHLGYGITSRRRTDPAIEIEELPPIDFVLLSHYHGDHFDRVAEAKLEKDLPIVTTPHAAAELAKKGFRETHPLETWETCRIRKGDARLSITATPGRHGPPIVAKGLPPVMGSVLEFRPGDAGPEEPPLLRLYISGDTLVYDALEEIPERYPEIDLALLHLGGTRILGVLLTMDAEQGVEAVDLIDPDTAIPIHYNDYEVFRSPLSNFKAAVEKAGLEDRVEYLEHGETFEFEPSDRRDREH